MFLPWKTDQTMDMCGITYASIYYDKQMVYDRYTS